MLSLYYISEDFLGILKFYEIFLVAGTNIIES